MVASATLLFLDGEWGFTSWSPPIPTALSSAKHRRGSPQSESKSGGRGWHWKAVCFEEKLKANRGGSPRASFEFEANCCKSCSASGHRHRRFGHPFSCGRPWPEASPATFRPPTPPFRPNLFIRASVATSLARHLPTNDAIVPAAHFYAGIRGWKPRPPSSDQRHQHRVFPVQISKYPLS